MLNIIAVGLGGFVGAVSRYLISLISVTETFLFPIKTFSINIIGCIVIGIIAAAASRNPEINPQLLLFLKVGRCGGFTTFSTFARRTYGNRISICSFERVDRGCGNLCRRISEYKIGEDDEYNTDFLR